MKQKIYIVVNLSVADGRIRYKFLGCQLYPLDNETHRQWMNVTQNQETVDIEFTVGGSEWRNCTYAVETEVELDKKLKTGNNVYILGQVHFSKEIIDGLVYSYKYTMWKPVVDRTRKGIEDFFHNWLHGRIDYSKYIVRSTKDSVDINILDSETKYKIVKLKIS